MTLLDLFQHTHLFDVSLAITLILTFNHEAITEIAVEWEASPITPSICDYSTIETRSYKLDKVMDTLICKAGFCNYSLYRSGPLSTGGFGKGHEEHPLKRQTNRSFVQHMLG